MINSKPLIIAYFDGDSEVKILSNFALSPFVLDGVLYNTVEGFWQSLKTEIPSLRNQIRLMDGLSAKKASWAIKGSESSSNLFTYMERLYRVGSEGHHILLERAIREKVNQNDLAKDALIASENRPLKHLLKNKYGQWRPGDSPALPAIVFERMLMNIRDELQNGNISANLPLPPSINDFL